MSVFRTVGSRVLQVTGPIEITKKMLTLAVMCTYHHGLRDVTASNRREKKKIRKRYSVFYVFLFLPFGRPVNH